MLSQITLYQKQPKTLLKQNKNNSNTTPSFKGPVEMGTQVLNFLNTSPAIGAVFVDFSSMVLPRTLVDFSRSKDAGLETGFRESAGTINHAMAGVVGLGAGYLVSSAFNRANGVKAHLLFANSDTIDTFGKFISDSIGTDGKYDAKKYWEQFFKGLEGFNTTEGSGVWKTLSKESVEAATSVMTNAGTSKYKIPKGALTRAMEIVTGETGAASTIKVNFVREENNVITRIPAKVEGSLENILNNAYTLRKTVLDKAAHDNTEIVKDLDKFLKGIKGRKSATVAAGLAVPVIVGMASQPFNRYLTKKRTGSDGFVGVEGRKPDKTIGFKVLKTVLGLAMGTAMVSCILKNPTALLKKGALKAWKEAPAEIAKKLQYKGAVPTIDQFKFIYGMTIMSRIFAARDKNEVRESAIKDSLGFANWLILGGLVSKLAAKFFNKGIVNYDKETQGKGLWNYITKSVEKTHEEILYPELKKLGIKATDGEKQIPFRKLMKLVKEAAKGSGENAEIARNALTKLKYKNYAQLLGYLYSGVVLGWGIPKLNIAITKAVEGKKSKKSENSDVLQDKMKIASAPVAQPLEPASKTFSAFGAYLN